MSDPTAPKPGSEERLSGGADQAVTDLAAAIEDARRSRRRDAIFGEDGGSAARSEDRRRDEEILRDVPPHHG